MERLPTLVIVGRPNVGKSTLFNRLAGRRIAVVQDDPGITRDRLYAEAEYGRQRYRIIDTGGILFSDDDPLIEQIRLQADMAMAEADAVIFMADAEEGLTPADWDLANELRGFPKPVFIAPNKADNTDRELNAQEFHSLGIGEVFPISAIHGFGVDSLVEAALEGAPEATAEEGDDSEEIRAAIVGRPNVGKSSLLNAVLGESRSIVSDIGGTTRDAIDTTVEALGRRFRLIDTAGIRRRGKVQGSVEYYMVHRAEQAMRRAECAVLVCDGREGLTDGDKRVAKIAHDEGKALIIVANKWDQMEPPDGNLGETTLIKKDFRRIVRDQAPEVSYAPVVFTSALEETGVQGVLKSIVRVHESWSTRLGTGVLNRLLRDAVYERPLTRRGRNLRLYYATMAEARPPTIVLFVNDPELVHFSYLRYLENRLRDEHRFEGTPIRLVLKKSRDE